MRGGGYYVYTMSRLSRTLYASNRQPLERRIFEHMPDSFTARYAVNRVAYFQECGDANGAIVREKEHQGDRDSSRGSHARE
jgi:predicted GIY-YIG superfamily endonuclease